MNRIQDFDEALSAWLHSKAPPQAPDRVLDAALGRVASQSQQRGWLQRVIGGTRMPTLLRAAAVTAVVAIAVLVGYELSNLNTSVGSPSPQPTPSTAPNGSLTPLPSPSVESSPSAAPAAADLVLRLEGGGEGGRVHVLTVLEDGRTITSSYEQFGANPSVERRLTAAGIQLLLDELDATGLSFLASADYSPVPRPGIEPPGFGGAGPAIAVGLPGGGTAVVSWYLFADIDHRNYFKPQPEAEALEALRARLSTLDKWLPAAAWADAQARPYVPLQYRIFIYSSRWGGTLDQLSVETATVSWPLVDGADVYGDVVDVVAHETGDVGPTPRCRVVSAEEGTAVIGSLEAAGAATSDEHLIAGTSFELGYRANRRQVVINLEPILPLAETSCGREITF